MPGSGLGKEAAIKLARRGHTVYASVHYENQVDEINKLAQRENLELEAFKLDILLPYDRDLISQYDIDVFIANSAIGDSGAVCEVSMNRIKDVFETNVFCNIQTTQIALKNMIQNKHNGRIIILSSLVRSSSNKVSISLLCFKICTRRICNLFKTRTKNATQYQHRCNYNRTRSLCYGI